MEADVVVVDELNVDFGGSEEGGGGRGNGFGERRLLGFIENGWFAWWLYARATTHLTNRSVKTFLMIVLWLCPTITAQTISTDPSPKQPGKLSLRGCISSGIGLRDQLTSRRIILPFYFGSFSAFEFPCYLYDGESVRARNDEPLDTRPAAVNSWVDHQVQHECTSDVASCARRCLVMRMVSAQSQLWREGRGFWTPALTA